MEFKKFFLRKFQDFFFRGQKIPGFLAPLISRIENSVTEFPRTFLAIFWLFWTKKTKPRQEGLEESLDSPSGAIDIVYTQFFGLI